MIARIYLKYEHMIHARSTPAVRVDADEEDVKDNEQTTAIEFERHFPVRLQFAILYCQITYFFVVFGLKKILKLNFFDNKLNEI